LPLFAAKIEDDGISDDPNVRKEKLLKPCTGTVMAIVSIPFGIATVLLLMIGYSTEPFLMLLSLVTGACFVMCYKGLVRVDPGTAVVLYDTGSYKGTIKNNGEFWLNPLSAKQQQIVNMKYENLEGKVIKVNDKIGNPIEIAMAVVWRVDDTYKVLWDVTDYKNYVKV
jgi:hypothetical protein